MLEPQQAVDKLKELGMVDDRIGSYVGVTGRTIFNIRHGKSPAYKTALRLDRLVKLASDFEKQAKALRDL